jgi:vesicle-fusing ATPase
MSTNLIISVSSSDELSNNNCIYINPDISHNFKYLKINNYIFSVKKNENVRIDQIEMNLNIRKITDLKLGMSINIEEYITIPPPSLIIKLILKMSHWHKNKFSSVDYHDCTQYLISKLKEQYVTKQQIIYCCFGERYLFCVDDFINIDNIDNLSNLSNNENNIFSQITDKTEIILKCDETITLKNIPSNILDTEFSVNKGLININPYDLEKMGIGGLSDEFITLFRRAFISRLLPPSYLQKLNIKHVKGVLLHGPPGTGKTLIARKIGEMLNCNLPKIVNGPEIFNKYVGGSEENIRKLFAEAEAEQNAKGNNSSLHLIIFDEFDALCKQRGMSKDSSGANDNVVNQLLSKIDGVVPLNNVLLIGLTNRKDLLDDAILRPGRFEVHIEISLPDENGRLEILNIHTKNLEINKMLSDDVNLKFLANKTKNFSGAELEGLVRSAQSYSIKKHIDPENPSKLIEIDKMEVTHADFEFALQEVKPSFGKSNDLFDKLLRNEIINYGEQWESIENKINNYINNFNLNIIVNTFKILIYGDSGCGKSTISSYIALKTNYPYIKIISPNVFVGYGELQKINIIRKIFDDAYKSKESVIILDDIERLIEFSEYGNRYSNAILQTLLVLINENAKKDHKLFIIGTCKKIHIMNLLEINEHFDKTLEIPNVKPEFIPAIFTKFKKNYNEKILIPMPIKKLITEIMIE